MNCYYSTQILLFPFVFQEEQYDHLDEADVTKVDKLTNDTMIWMNSAMNQQSKQSLMVDPSVKVKDIKAKTRVSVCSWQHRTRALRLESLLYAKSTLRFLK